ncbi:hypothetical protein ANN_02107 [Periplaneta americana]|uniref:Uncharacterized protein n=1 Tax=Periplaneta americana TaxID=6978 RepID=A0ABQ8TXV5_PERAM|nr:hypothetical protein ANN_02107 [Periplaneta americana]
MAGLCEGGNEHPGSLKARLYKRPYMTKFVSLVPQIYSAKDIQQAVDSSPGNSDLTVKQNIHFTTVFELRAASEEALVFRPNQGMLGKSRLAQIARYVAATGQREKKELVGSLVEKKLASEGCIGRNSEREKSSGQKKISDDRRH